MRVVEVVEYGPPENMRLREMPDPMPGKGEAVVRVHAAGINFADILMRLGYYTGVPKPPFIPGLEGSGVVESAGEGVKLRKGQRVSFLSFGKAYADKICLPAAQLTPLPDDFDLDDAAALPVNFLTAWQGLEWMAHLRKGERILIHAAAGGVGIAAIQLAKLIGAEIFATASAAKHEFVREQGAHHTIDYRTQDFEREVRRLTRGEGVDVVLDAVGAESYRKGYRLLRHGGRLICFGLSAAVGGPGRSLQALKAWWNTPSFNALDLIGKNRTVIGLHVGTLARARPELLQKWMGELIKRYAKGKIRPHVGKTFPLEEAARAHHFIHARKNIGKVLLKPDAQARGANKS